MSMGDSLRIPILKTKTLTGSGNFTVPNIPGINRLIIIGSGGGGGGGGGFKVIGFIPGPSGGGGCGAGSITDVLSVVPGQVIAFSVGGGGAGVFSSAASAVTVGGIGGSTSFGSKFP